MSTVEEEVDRKIAEGRKQFFRRNADLAAALSRKTPEELVEFLRRDIGEKVYYMPAHVSALLDQYDELRRRLDAIEKLHHTEPDPFRPGPDCCSECSGDERTEPHPCDTVKLARGESL